MRTMIFIQSFYCGTMWIAECGGCALTDKRAPTDTVAGSEHIAKTRLRGAYMEYAQEALKRLNSINDRFDEQGNSQKKEG